MKKSSQFIEAEQIAFEEVSDNWVALKLGDEKFVMDLDTLTDLTFRCASFLAYLESKEEEQTYSSCPCAVEAKVH